MKLEQMFPKLNDLTPEEQALNIITMRSKRELDLIDYREGAKLIKRRSKKQAVKSNTILNPEQKALMKMLGLSVKDLKRLQNE